MRDSRKVTLMVVDDDPDMRALLGLSFKRQGYDIVEAAGGHAAYDIIQTANIDLVVTDILMPEGDGFELIDRIRSLCPRCPPIVVVTGCGDISMKELCLRGAEAVFFKPFDRTSLNSAVRRLVNI